MVEQLTAAELADRIDRGDAVALIDTRPAEAFESWHLPGATNVPYDPREGFEDAMLEAVRRHGGGKPVVAICGKGLTSTPFAFELERAGYADVTVVKGGMADWSAVYEVVDVPTGGDLVVRQVQRRGKGCLGYVLGSRATGDAVVVDATRHVETFAVAAEEAGLTIRAALDTHVHADHLTGTPRLAQRLGVPYYLGEHAADRGVDYDYEPVADGDVIDAGDLSLEAIHAPGHTTEMVAYRVGDDPLTADTLFVDGVGRTELQFGDDDAARGAALLYETLHDRFQAVPDDAWVLPGHVTVTADGRFEGGQYGEPIRARLGELRATLDVLSLDREAFLERVAGDPPAKPPNYERVIAVNTGHDRPETDDEAAELELGPNNCAA